MTRDQSLWVTSDHAQNRPRAIFLRELASRVPQVLQHLHDHVLPEYSRIYPQISAETSRGPRIQHVKNFVGWLFKDEAPVVVQENLPDILYWRNIDRLEPQYPALSGLKDLLLRWSRDFRLTDEWLLDVALQTLYLLQKTPMRPRLHFWRLSVFNLPPLSLDRMLRFKDRGWDPHLDTWKEFHDNISAAFDEHLKQYRTTVEAFLEKSGWKRVPEIRQRKHYTWLVLFQVKGWSPEHILDRFPSNDDRNTEESTITKGVQSAARLAGVTLRASMKGKGPRPRRVKRE
jgi:hypothetical protein